MELLGICKLIRVAVLAKWKVDVQKDGFLPRKYQWTASS